jgi:hypothetical protein
MRPNHLFSRRRALPGALLGLAALTLTWSSVASAATLYVATTGDDAGSCQSESAPCKTITRGIGLMGSGDTLVVDDGTYAESITHMPSGSPGAYTSIVAKHDWAVVIDGSQFADDFTNGITVSSKSYVLVRGFRVRMNQANGNNLPIMVPYSDHVKIQRCSGSYGPTAGNAASIGVGPASSYVLVEESFAFGGSRYQFLAYQSDHVIVRRSVARNDYWNGTLQCAGFVNYDSTATAWQNDVALDSDTANCSGRLFGGFFNENKTDTQPDTSQSLQGNIVLNVQAYYAGDLDWVTTGTRTIEDMVIWGSTGGYWGDQGPGLAAHTSATRMTIGGITGTYDGPNAAAAHGTGFDIYSDIDNSLTNSLLVKDQSYGVADYTASDYNAFSGNGANYGGVHTAAAGPHDQNVDATSSLKYLPRIEPGTTLATAGEGGGQIGANIQFMVGATGSLQDDPGWDQPTTQSLWPFPNEDVIRSDMAAYTGPGGAGARGFTSGSSLDGSPQTLTKYIWEYLGNQIPQEIYGLQVTVGNLPTGVVGATYLATVSASGGAAPYTWSVIGTLPPGLALAADTGVISGVPTSSGATTFTIAAHDSQSPALTASMPLTLDVDAVAQGAGGGASSGVTTGSGGTAGSAGSTGDPSGAGGSDSSAASGASTEAGGLGSAGVGSAGVGSAGVGGGGLGDGDPSDGEDAGQPGCSVAMAARDAGRGGSRGRDGAAIASIALLGLAVSRRRRLAAPAR